LVYGLCIVVAIVVTAIVAVSLAQVSASGDLYIVQRNGEIYIEWYNGLTTVTIMKINATNIAIYKPMIYNNQLIDNYFVNYTTLTSNYYPASVIDQLILGNVSSVKNWALSTFYTKSQVDTMLSNLKNYTDRNILSNRTYVLTTVGAWIQGNLSTSTIISYVNQNILGNVSALHNYTDANILGNFSALKSYVDSNIASNITSLNTSIVSWVETNYYNKSIIDSWNLIKNYRLSQSLNGYGYGIYNLSYVGIGAVIFGTTPYGFDLNYSGGYLARYFAANHSIMLYANLNIMEPYSIAVEGWDAIYKAYDRYAGKWYELIGVYHGWTSDAIWIGGYNYYLPRNGNVNLSYAKYLYVGHYPSGSPVMIVDLGNPNGYYHVNVTGGIYADKIDINNSVYSLPYGWVTPFSLDAKSLSRIQNIFSTITTIPPNTASWTVLNVTWHGTVILNMFIYGANYVTELTIDLDGVTKTISFTGAGTYAWIPLTFVVDKNLVIYMNNTSTATNVYVYATVVETS